MLTQAQADDGTSLIQGQVNGLRLLDAITTHATAAHSIPQVARIPAAETESVIYLTDDYTDAARADTSVAPAVISGTQYYGWSNGRLFDAAGTVTRADTGCIIAIVGEELSSGYTINQIWSYNRDCFAGATAVRINGADYSNVALQSSLGSWVLTVTGAPDLSASSFTFNVQLGTDWVYETTTGTAFDAGLWEWDADTTAYVRLSGGDGDITAVTTNASSGLFGGKHTGRGSSERGSRPAPSDDHRDRRFGRRLPRVRRHERRRTTPPSRFASTGSWRASTATP